MVANIIKYNIIIILYRINRCHSNCHLPSGTPRDILLLFYGHRYIYDISNASYYSTGMDRMSFVDCSGRISVDLRPTPEFLYNYMLRMEVIGFLMTCIEVFLNSSRTPSLRAVGDMGAILY